MRLPPKTGTIVVPVTENQPWRPSFNQQMVCLDVLCLTAETASLPAYRLAPKNRRTSDCL